MSAFDERQRGFEKKFAHDAELRFKVEARRNKLLAKWAAGLLGRDDADAYAAEIIASDFEEAGDADVLRKLAKDFEEKGVQIGQAEIRAKIDACMREAQESFM